MDWISTHDKPRWTVQEGYAITDLIDDPKLIANGATLQPGQMIKSINGQAVEEIVRKNGELVAWSTPGMRKRRAEEESVFLNELEAQIIVLDDDGQSREIRVGSIPRHDVRLNDTTEENWSLRFLEDSIAVFRIRAFSIADWNEWRETALEDRGKVLDSTYRKITSQFSRIVEREPKALIIDVRGNGGGTDLLGIHVARHIVANRFKYFLLSAPNDDGWTPFGGITYRPVGDASACWTRDLYLLVDEGCFSTTDNFLRCVSDLLPDATIIGRPTGGGTGAPGKVAELTHSKAVITLCTQRVQGPDGEMIEGRGTKPDYLVEWTRQDILEQQDPELGLAAELIQNKK